jgi:hypothetical protein
VSLPKSYAEISETLRLMGISPPWNWEERRVTRSGIRRYLMRAYDHPNLYKDQPWLRLWKQIIWTRSMCKALNVVIPAQLWDEDKARLAAKLAVADNTNPEEKEKALRWARR